jgi:hypothetical protein
VSVGKSRTGLRFNPAAYRTGDITYITVVYQLRNSDMREALAEVGGRRVGTEERMTHFSQEARRNWPPAALEMRSAQPEIAVPLIGFGVFHTRDGCAPSLLQLDQGQSCGAVARPAETGLFSM